MNIDNIAKCNIFTGLQPETIKDILVSVQTEEPFFKKGDLLALQGEPCNRLIIITKGSVKAEMIDPSGKVVKVEDISAPQALAILFLFGKKNKFPVQVTACEDVETLIIHKQSVLKMLTQNEQLLKNYLDVSANYASVLTEKLNIMSFRTIRQKLSMYILNLSEGENNLKLDRSQNALAEYFGVSRPSLARELRNMQDDGLISVDNKNILIVDRNKLIHLIKFL
ncbi:Crp/Fnr family transcriptional regulator [Dysgonomonas sp. Marseille-P4677]|uniref:Crp/Fnr family transcriptional regulator n=1 Tax=Dysgonomonas sp. Marseille-P4677 TaxID=2364790 RepID=UPI00191373F3|nr:Crp/Fnr family transcriptional regulator [Dysgonomonas sp. Marseille-P4677]MBK5720375.1 Crp/Fnr family transcriptional regulator [Dysgonomonas sp. Marseille-P4677]